jgi:hypothetical protein
MKTADPALTSPIDDRASWLGPLPMQGNRLRMIVVAFAICFALWHIATNIWLNEPGKWQNAIHFGGFAFLAAVTISPFGRNANKAWALAFDVTYGLLIASAALWVAYAENGVYERTLAVTGQSWQFTWVDWAAGGPSDFCGAGSVAPRFGVGHPDPDHHLAELHPLSGQLSARRVPRRQLAAQ